MTTVLVTDPAPTTVVISDPGPSSVAIGTPVYTISVIEQSVGVSVSGDDVTVVTTSTAAASVASEVSTQVVTVSEPTTVTFALPQVEVVTVGTQGPQGLTAEDANMQFRNRVDFVDDAPSAGMTTVYRGWAKPGTGDGSAAVWNVQKLVINTEDDVTESGFADGDSKFDNVWDNRSGLSYS